MPKPPAEVTEVERTQLIAFVTQDLQNVAWDPGAFDQWFEDPTARFGKFGIRLLRDPLIRAATVVHDVRALDLNRLPVGVLYGLDECAKALFHVHQQFKDFKEAAGDDAFEGLLRGARDVADRLLMTAGPWIGYVGNRDRGTIKTMLQAVGEAQQQVISAQTLLRQATDEVNGTRRSLVDRGRVLQQEAEDIVANLRLASAPTGVSAHAEAFDKAAKKHGAWAWFWLVFTAVAGGGAVYGLVKWLRDDQLAPDATNAAIAQYVMTRAVVLLFGVYLTVWAARNYRAQRHLNVLYDHRARALSTFKTFLDSTTDPVTKNAVLLETTRSIFSTGATGYLGGDDDGGADGLLAIAKLAAGGKDK